MDAATNPNEVKLTEEKLNALFRTIGEHLLPVAQKLRQMPNAEQAFDNVYSPEAFEKIVRLEALLDARMAKVLARLVGLKELHRH